MNGHTAFDRACDAISELYGDTSIPRGMLVDMLETIRGDIDDYLEGLKDDGKPTMKQPHDLWQEADGDPARYVALMREHGHAITAETVRPRPPEELHIVGDESRKRFNEGKRGCYPFEITSADGTKVRGHIRVGASSGRKCEFCRRKSGTDLCDYPTGRACVCCGGSGRAFAGGACGTCDGSGNETCSRRFCKSCGWVKSEEEGYCPDHVERAGGTKPTAHRYPEPPKPRWIKARYGGRCRACRGDIASGSRVLYFSDEHGGKTIRVMCEPCGLRHTGRGQTTLFEGAP